MSVNPESPLADRRPAPSSMASRVLAGWVFALLALTNAMAAAAEQQFPDVLAARVTARGADSFDFDVTVSSSYDTPRRYADGFRAMGKDGRVFGERKLLHDHASEQPFTRDLHGVRIPPGIGVVLIEARDQKYGYGGKTLELVLPGR